MDAAVAGLVGALGGAGITTVLTIYRDHRNSKEKYKSMLYEKRLGTYQEALHLTFEFVESIPDSIYELKKDRMDEIAAANKKLIEFWKLHCLYFDSESVNAITSLVQKFKAVYDIFNGLSNPPTQENVSKYMKLISECQKSTTKVIIALEKGIGMKHIEKQRIRKV